MCTQWCSRLLHYHFMSTPHIQVWYTDRCKGNILGNFFLTLFSHSFGNIDCLFFLQTRWKGHRYVYKLNVSIKIFNELMLWCEITFIYYFVSSYNTVYFSNIEKYFILSFLSHIIRNSFSSLENVCILVWIYHYFLDIGDLDNCAWCFWQYSTYWYVLVIAKKHDPLTYKSD